MLSLVAPLAGSNQTRTRRTKFEQPPPTNDEPFDLSLVSHALSTKQRTKVTHARERPLLWNLMWPAAGVPDGSFYFDNQPNVLDQFLVNKNMATDEARLRANPSTALILKPPEMVDGGAYAKPIPFGGMGKPVNLDRLLRPFPNHHDGDRPRLGARVEVGEVVEAHCCDAPMVRQAVMGPLSRRR